tara:strand:- start:60 stop:884 length:825 start_codon:yes stop_codon:yes gene_type:complete
MIYRLTLILLLLLLCIRVATAQCTASYTQSTFPTSVLIIGATDEVCITEDITINSYTTILIYGGGKLRIYNNSTFNLKGSLTLYPGATIHLEDCGSKINVDGSYTGANPNDCEVKVYCGSCSSSPVSNFFTTTSSPAFLDVCCEAPLPVELLRFDCIKDQISWSTATEVNSDYFTLYHSTDGITFKKIKTFKAQGQSSTLTNYYHTATKNGYYKLTQTDYNGMTTQFDVVYCNGVVKATLVKRYNLLGQEVNNDYKGLVIEVYSDGSTKTVLSQ